jgi:hypothetical protein
MELQNYIFENINYIDNLKSLDFKIKNFNKYGLTLIKYPYDKNIDTNTYERYLKGCIIDNKTNKIVFIPPVKADLLNTNIDINNYQVQELFDGTMINMFFHNDEWLLSTRSDIGLNNKWSKKSFKQMFQESCNIDYDRLNKNHTYSFVLQHVENRNVSIVQENKCILVEVYDRDTLQMVDLNIYNAQEYNGFKIVNDYKIDSLDELINNIINVEDPSKFNYKGFTIKSNGKRLKFINPDFENVKNLKINSNNLLFEYCSHTLKNTKDMYLYYFGEHNIAYAKYDIVLDIFKRDLLDTYVNANIKKELEKKEISFQLKPLVYELHGIYLKTHKKINSRKVEEYIMSLEPDRLTFILKYYL